MGALKQGYGSIFDTVFGERSTGRKSVHVRGTGCFMLGSKAKVTGILYVHISYGTVKKIKKIVFFINRSHRYIR